MARVYHIDTKNGIGYDYWDGTITIEECFDNVRQIFADANWPPHRRLHLADLRTVTADLDISMSIEKTIMDFCITHAEVLTNLKVAILGYDVFTKGLSFKEHIIQYPLSMTVFNSLDIACEWLGIDPVEAERILKQLRTKMGK